MNSRSLTTGGLYVPTKSHFRFIWWNSNPMISIFRSKGRIFNGLQGILSWTYNIRPPTYLLRSHLKILKPFIWNCLFGKVSSSLDSDIRNILKFSINSANISYLFLKELILRIKVTYYYSAWITQTLSFDVSEVISWLFK